MTIAEAALLVGGFIAVAVGLIDIFLTVLHYEGYGFLSGWVYRAAWALHRGLVVRLPEGRRRGAFSFGGPLLVVSSIVTWVLLVWLGFALIYASALNTAFQVEGGRLLTFIDAVYFSAVSLSTVGYGEIYAIEPFFQMLSVLEALAGFSILSLVVAYIIGVYEAVRDQSLLAATLDDQTGGTADPLDLADAWLQRQSAESEWSTLHRGLIQMDESLHRYPIVYYFRRSPAHRSLPYVLAMLSEAAASVRWAPPSDHGPSRSPALEGLLAALRRITRQLDDRFSQQEPEARDDAVSDGQLRAHFERATARLARTSGAGSVGEDRESRFEVWRSFMEPVYSFAGASARDLAYDADEGIPLGNGS